MCGIFAYAGKNNAAPILIEGLKRLEYRGYDSWGVAVQENNAIHVVKEVGKISKIDSLNQLPHAKIGIAHTRWATHGGITQTNAHPHYSSDNSFVLAQNGIVQNYEPLKEMLQKKGYKFISETDTEVIVRLVEEKLLGISSLRLAVRAAVKELEGRNTVILLSNKGEIIAARNGSPLVAGRTASDDLIVSSDTLSFAPIAQKMLVIDNGQIVQIHDKEMHIFDITSDKELKYNWEDINLRNDKVDKEEFDHFLIKEIHETPKALEQIVRQDKKSYLALAHALKAARTVYTIGSGTAGVAAAQIAYYLREFAKINAISLVGADALEYVELFSKEDVIIAPSQSGETADVLEVLEFAHKKGLKIASYVNMPGAMMTRMSDFKFMAEAGPEVSVVSTKIFTSQITWGYLVAKTVSDGFDEGITHINSLIEAMKRYLKNQSNINLVKNLAEKLINVDDIFLLGKGQNFYIVKEGMVKLIECTYKHAHAMPAGDLKHYAITLMQPGVQILVAFSDDSSMSDVINAVNEVKTRGAEVTAIGSKSSKNFNSFIKVPEVKELNSVMNVIPLQLLAYYIGIQLGNEVDKPRNIAKSVTVK